MKLLEKAVETLLNFNKDKKMKALLYFLHLLSNRPKWVIVALLLYGAFQIICLSMVLRSGDVDSINFTPWSFTLQKKKASLPAPARTSPEQNTNPLKSQLSGQ